jgi:hypothetical protein
MKPSDKTRQAPSTRLRFAAFPDDSQRSTTPGHYHRRQVKQCGDIKWLGQLVKLSAALHGQTIGLNEPADGFWQIYFGPRLLGHFHMALPHLGLVRPARKVLPMSPV